ncbi:hypothetical protein FYK55_23580 [Roseiconus nitratireducens]|uniref:Uncharacterized protein n=1 Tax=Roseiconus nitratireducens TaxID=2605748 RepID=A0A5M6D1N5_9BACT|nr:hypothetical protein [Roseiconus nitratireducens]KAA5539559.1 hypothetical protein FYK55_23580 [Roseiconus nitratireducens]
MNLELFREFVAADDDEAEDAIDDAEMFYLFGEAKFDELVRALNEFLSGSPLTVTDTAPPNEWATPRFECAGRSSTFKTMICQEDVFNALLAVDAVIGDEVKVYVATDTLGDREVAVTILPTVFADDLRSHDPAAFDARLTSLSTDRDPFDG